MEVYSAIRDVKPSRDSHADSRLLSSNVFTFSEITEPRSVDGRQTSVASDEEAGEDRLTSRSQLTSLLLHGRDILQFTAVKRM